MLYIWCFTTCLMNNSSPSSYLRYHLHDLLRQVTNTTWPESLNVVYAV